MSKLTNCDATEQAAMVVRGEVSARELVDAAIQQAHAVNGDINAIIHPRFEKAQQEASGTLPQGAFTGVPLVLKDLGAPLVGEPHHMGTRFLKEAGYIAPSNSYLTDRFLRAGFVVIGRTNTPEFGNTITTEPLSYGPSHNPWNLEHSTGGSSGGSAASVAAHIVPVGHANDGGGSIRIPAGFNGLVGLKSTFGRIPRGPHAEYGNLTVTIGGMTRSVRDTARWFDVCNGHHAADPLSLPRVDGWENALGTVNVAGLRVAIVQDWDGAVLSPAMWNVLLEAADHLVASAGLRRIDGVNTELPRMGAAWSISGMIEIRAALGDMWPACADDLTPEMRAGLQLTEGRYGEAERTKIEARRAAVNLRMSQIFDEVDLVITATNPDIAFPAEGPLPNTFGGIKAGAGNNGLLTFPCNLHGNPGISVPAGFVDGLPVGLQIIGPHFSEQILLELALRLERERPWPLVATGAPI